MQLIFVPCFNISLFVVLQNYLFFIIEKFSYHKSRIRYSPVGRMRKQEVLEMLNVLGVVYDDGILFASVVSMKFKVGSGSNSGREKTKSIIHSKFFTPTCRKSSYVAPT